MRPSPPYALTSLQAHWLRLFGCTPFRRIPQPPGFHLVVSAIIGLGLRRETSTLKSRPNQIYSLGPIRIQHLIGQRNENHYERNGKDAEHTDLLHKIGHPLILE